MLTNLIGVEQKYCNVTAQRKKNTEYVNDTKKPILVYITSEGNYDSGDFNAVVDGMEIAKFNIAQIGYMRSCFSFIVPPNSTYQLKCDPSEQIFFWIELR